MLPDGYVEPSGFLGVTTASPFGLRVISISLGFSVVGVSGVTLPGVVTGTSTAGLPGSVILPVPGTLPSGNSLFGTLPLPFSPIVTVIGFPSLPGISTLVPGGNVEPSGLFGVTVTSPVLGSCSTSSVGVLWAGVVTLGTSSVGLPGSVILPVPGTLPSGNSLFGTLPFPSSPMVTVIG